MKKTRRNRNKITNVKASIYPAEKPYKNTQELLDLAEKTNQIEIVTPEQRNFYIKKNKKDSIKESFLLPKNRYHTHCNAIGAFSYFRIYQTRQY